MNKLIPYKKLKWTVLLVAFIVSLTNCSTVSEIGTDNWRDYFRPGRSKEEIARDFNLYRGNWWNYYVRGRWYAEGGYDGEAVQDFKKAISQRSRDEGSARSYGLHFWEYFAHRELGIVYYNQKKYEEAKNELETSLATADSARAKFYLNKCNEEILKMTNSDQKSPEIRVTSHTNGDIVNTPVAKLSGIATDDFYVHNVYIQGEKLFTELAKKDLLFAGEVPLHSGENVIRLEAADLAGKSARQDFMLTLDMRPPILSLDDVRIVKENGREIVTLKGTVVDDYGIKNLYINDTEVPLVPEKEINFKQEFNITQNQKISFKVIDKAGNETRGEQHIDRKASLWQKDTLNNSNGIASPQPMPVRIASGTIDKGMLRTLLASQEAAVSQLSSGNPPQENEQNKKDENKSHSTSQEAETDTIPPVIHTDIKSGIVHDKQIFFSGDVHDDGGVARILLNQTPLDIRPGKHVFFNQLLPLNEGENTIVIKAFDTQGNETQQSPITITRKDFELLETDARYTVALLPLRTYEKQGVSQDILYSMVLKAFDEEPKRFNFVERDKTKLEKILQEQKISNTELTSPDTAIKIGTIRAAEGMFFGASEEDTKGINVTLRLVDTETTQVLANADVYDEDKSQKNLEWLIHGLSMKIKQQFPILQGTVVRVAGNGFHINMGSASGISVGMKLLLFREIKEDNLIFKEPLDIVARVTQVQSETSFARVIKEGAKKIEKQDMAIIK